MEGLRNIFPFLSAISERSASNRRTGGRVATVGLRSNRGKVLDLSKTGTRLATRMPWREGEEREMTLTGEALSVRLNARCVWVRRDSAFNYVVGIAFQNVSDEQAMGLSELARAYSARLEHEDAERQRQLGVDTAKKAA